MTAGEYGTPTHYLKGKDIKVPFDCLWHCYTRKFEQIIYNPSHSGHGVNVGHDGSYIKPEEFEKW